MTARAVTARTRTERQAPRREPAASARPGKVTAAASAAKRPRAGTAAKPRTSANKPPATAARPRPASSRDAAGARRAFAAFMLLGGAVLATMAVSVGVHQQSTANAYRLTDLRATLQAARRTGEGLSVKVLSMSTPGRIESVAARSLAMVEPDSITFLRRPQAARRTAPRREAPRRRPGALSTAGSWLKEAAQDFTILSLGELGLPSAGL